MGANPVIKYVIGHLRGDQSLAWSFFINGVLAYVLVTLLVVFLGTRFDLNVYVGIAVLLLTAVWSVVGFALAAVKTLKGNGGYLMKAFAIAVLGIAVVVVIGIANDLRHILPPW